MKSRNRALWAVIVLVAVVGCGDDRLEGDARQVVEDGEPLITEMVADLPGFTVTTQLRAPQGCEPMGCVDQVWFGVVRAVHPETDTEAEALAIREQLQTAAREAGYTYACTDSLASGNVSYWTHPDLPGTAEIAHGGNNPLFGHTNIPLTGFTCEP